MPSSLSIALANSLKLSLLPASKPKEDDQSSSCILCQVELLLNEFPQILISVDTFRSNVAKQCIQKGACIVNDISAGNMDPKMFETVAKLQVPYILMHMQGTPQNMQTNPVYDDIVKDVLFYFSQKITKLRALGVNDLITDVGFGFGKTMVYERSRRKQKRLRKPQSKHGCSHPSQRS